LTRTSILHISKSLNVEFPQFSRDKTPDKGTGRDQKEREGRKERKGVMGCGGEEGEIARPLVSA